MEKNKKDICENLENFLKQKQEKMYKEYEKEELSKMMTIRMPVSLIEKLDKIAISKHITRSSLIKLILGEYEAK